MNFSHYLMATRNKTGRSITKLWSLAKHNPVMSICGVLVLGVLLATAVATGLHPQKTSVTTGADVSTAQPTAKAEPAAAQTSVTTPDLPAQQATGQNAAKTTPSLSTPRTNVTSPKTVIVSTVAVSARAGGYTDPIAVHMSDNSAVRWGFKEASGALIGVDILPAQAVTTFTARLYIPAELAAGTYTMQFYPYSGPNSPVGTIKVTVTAVPKFTVSIPTNRQTLSIPAGSPGVFTNFSFSIQRLAGHTAAFVDKNFDITCAPDFLHDNDVIGTILMSGSENGVVTLFVNSSAPDGEYCGQVFVADADGQYATANFTFVITH